MNSDFFPAGLAKGAMAICLPSGKELMSEPEFAKWWEQRGLCETGFLDSLRKHLAKLLGLSFRQLGLVCDSAILGPKSSWDTSRPLVAVVRQHVQLDEADHGRFLQAANDGLEEKVSEFLEMPCQPDPHAMFLTSALHVAAGCGYLEMVRSLLEAGANKDRDDIGQFDFGDSLPIRMTPLGAAAYRGHVEVVGCLLEAGADLNKEDGRQYTPLLRAVWCGHMAILQILLAAGADTEACNTGGETPLIAAASQGDAWMVRRLLKAKADADVACGRGGTALAYAAAAGFWLVVRCLLAQMSGDRAERC